MSSRGTGSPRTLLVGIDAACESVLTPLLEAGAVPALARLFEAGSAGPLESQIPPWTASAWPSIYTGTNPGKHGVFDFLAFEGYDWSVVDATRVRRPSVWELLSHHGRSSVVVNVPVTHPPRAFDGALVPGYAAPENPRCHPSDLLADLRAQLGDYRVYPAHTGESDPDRDRIVDEHVALAGQRGRAFRYLLDRFEPDFGFVQFQGTDSVVHELPGDRDALRAVYEAVDRAVGAILDRADPETVLVVSDHGIGHYAGREVRVNEVLRRAGYLETVRGGRGMPTWATVRDYHLAAGEDLTRAEASPLARAAASLARLGLTSQRLESLLAPLGLDELAVGLAPTVAVSAAAEQVDFPASRAYCRSRLECGVRLNVEGRDPDGVVPAESYERVRGEVIELLADLETPDGEPVFETVVPREAIYDGPATEAAVDVVTVPAGFEHFLSGRLGDDVFAEPPEPWNHKPTGVVVAAGPGVEGDESLAGAHIFDVAPTVLASLDLPVAEGMDGSVLPVVEATGVEAYPEVEPLRVESPRSETVERRLTELGYLE